jgi:hypothetical protein
VSAKRELKCAFCPRRYSTWWNLRVHVYYDHRDEYEKLNAYKAADFEMRVL